MRSNAKINENENKKKIKQTKKQTQKYAMNYLFALTNKIEVRQQSESRMCSRKMNEIP